MGVAVGTFVGVAVGAGEIVGVAVGASVVYWMYGRLPHTPQVSGQY